MKKTIITFAILSTLTFLVLYLFKVNNLNKIEEPIDAVESKGISQIELDKEVLVSERLDSTLRENDEEIEEVKYCSEFNFTSFQQQGDSIKVFMNNALDPTLDEKHYWEEKFFCAFPNSYIEMDSLFGFNHKAAPLYHSEIAKDGSFFGSMNSIISFFGELKSIPDEHYYEKYINICVDGYWQADNIRAAFGFGKRLINYPSQACNALEKRNDEDIKSVFRFIFDSIHPKHEMNEKFYTSLFPKVQKESQRLATLLTEAYEQLMSENHDH